MYVRAIKARNRHYVSIVRGYRDAQGKVKQKTIKNLGSYRTEEEKLKLFEIGNRLIGKIRDEEKPAKLEEGYFEIKRENWGAESFISTLLGAFNIETCIKKLTQDRKIEYDLYNAIKFMLTTRFIDPCSKLSAFKKQDYYAGFEQVELHHMYKALDELSFYKEEICSHIFRKQKQFTEIKVVFFDVTTLHFESQNADVLRDFGYSKDCKFNEVQVVLSLMINSDGRPLGYEIFKGNTAEGSTLLPCLKQLQEKHKIKEVIIVADRGISSFSNLKTIKDAGFDYIIASKLRTFTKERQALVLNEEGYQTISSEEDVIKYKTIDGTLTKQGDLKQKMVCIYSSKRANKDIRDRERLIERAKEMLASGQFKDKRGAKKYIKMENNSTALLNIDKIEEDRSFDGYYVLAYSREDMEPLEVVSAYKGLWKIEESFRTCKHFFETRPIFHWTPRRIRGHIMLNFIALVLEKHAEQVLKVGRKKSDPPISYGFIRNAISGMERSLINNGGSIVTLYSALSDEQLKILSTFKIEVPKNCILSK